MRRNLDYTIHFGESNEFRLIREMFEEQPSHGVYQGYLVEDNSQSVQFTPEQFAELHAAIHEMDRMRDQHMETLTDGESVGAVERAIALEPAPDGSESGTKHELAMDLLRWLASDSGHRVASFHEAFQWLFDADLLIHTAGDNYTISDAGRALLAAQTPEEESEAEPISESDVSMLRLLLYGSGTLTMGHPALNCFRVRGWVAVTEETESWPTSEREYGITDKGRRVLAEQEG